MLQLDVAANIFWIELKKAKVPKYQDAFQYKDLSKALLGPI